MDKHLATGVCAFSRDQWRRPDAPSSDAGSPAARRILADDLAPACNRPAGPLQTGPRGHARRARGAAAPAATRYEAPSRRRAEPPTREALPRHETEGAAGGGSQRVLREAGQSLARQTGAGLGQAGRSLAHWLNRVVRKPQPADSLLASLRLIPMVAALGLTALALGGAMALASLAGGLAPAVAAGDGSGTLLGQPASPPTADTAATASELPQSTPRSQWARGAVPLLYQTDGEWAAVPYAGATVGESGCGPTSLSMVYVALTGKTDRDPAAMAAFSEREGFVEDGLTAWRLMTDGARKLGLRSHELPADASALRAELRAGHPVICSMGPGDFTAKGHFIVLTTVDENGDIVVHDPNSEARSRQPWDAQRVLGQCRNLWSFERA